LVSQDRVEDFGRVLRHTEHPIRKLNEEMGIEVPIARQRLYGGYPQRHSYSGGNTYRGRGRYSNDNRGRQSYGESRYGNGSSGRRYNYGQRQGGNVRNRYHY
jgi:ATP-dependent RNA helicase DeaD